VANEGDAALHEHTNARPMESREHLALPSAPSWQVMLMLDANDRSAAGKQTHTRDCWD